MPVAHAARLGQVFEQSIWDGLVSAIGGPVEIPPALRKSVGTAFTDKFGAAALRELIGHFSRDGIATVLDPQPDRIEAKVRWIALYLFTGSADPSDENAPIDNYVHALGWKSLRFAKAPGLCAGPDFGYWEKPWGTA